MCTDFGGLQIRRSSMDIDALSFTASPDSREWVRDSDSFIGKTTSSQLCNSDTTCRRAPCQTSEKRASIGRAQEVPLILRHPWNVFSADENVWLLTEVPCDGSMSLG